MQNLTNNQLALARNIRTLAVNACQQRHDRIVATRAANNRHDESLTLKQNADVIAKLPLISDGKWWIATGAEYDFSDAQQVDRFNNWFVRTHLEDDNRLMTMLKHMIVFDNIDS